MTEYVTEEQALHELVHGSVDPRLALAEDNACWAATLVRRMKQAREAAGQTLEDLAWQMGISVDEARALEAGELDFTILDLRVWASAVGKVVRYEVEDSHHVAAEKGMHSTEAHRAIGKTTAETPNWRRQKSPRRGVDLGLAASAGLATR